VCVRVCVTRSPEDPRELWRLCCRSGCCLTKIVIVEKLQPQETSTAFTIKC